MRRSVHRDFYRAAWLFSIFLISFTSIPCADAAVTVKDIYLNNELVNENVLLGTPVGEFTALKQEDSPTPPPLKYIFTLVDDPSPFAHFMKPL
jgi:hypothetical protein